jgi:LPS export ABC transporter protein LptC
MKTNYFSLIILGLALWACDEDKSLEKVKPYQGAMIESQQIETLYSDSAKLKMRIKAPKQQQLQNGNLIYPETIEVFFYNEKKQESSKLTALKGFYDKEKNLYTATGKVVVRDLLENKTLKTEVLHWSPNEKRIFTDKFVVIESGENVVKGEGFTANQDFQYYKILKPTGSGIIKKKPKQSE